jgi:hypothetical protein
MGDAERSLRKKSRIVTGFHRLGIVLAVPVFLGALGTGISAWFSNDGPIAADPAAASYVAGRSASVRVAGEPILPALLRVETAPLAVAVNDNGDVVSLRKDRQWMPLSLSVDEKAALLSATRERRRILNGEVESFKKTEVDAGKIRTFAFYRADLAKPQPGKNADDEATFAAVRSIMVFERRRGEVIAADEQPVLVGNLLVQMTEDKGLPYHGWKHLKHGFDWERMAWAGALAAFALLIYVLARALGWVIDGFLSQPES